MKNFASVALVLALILGGLTWQSGITAEQVRERVQTIVDEW